jgi:hypothetical protein
MKAFVVAPLVLLGCFPYSELPNNRADPKLRKLSEATILEMNINLFKQTGLCPGKEGKLYVNATVKWPGMKPVPRTLGSDVDSLDPASFQIQGTLLKGDQNAHLFPDADVVKSIESGFVIDVTYAPQPTKFHFHEMFPPEYSCFDGWAENAGMGGGGGGGNGGNNGDIGHNGGHGDSGGQGEHGPNGGKITAYITVVSTKFYPKLYAVIANGTFFLAPADRNLTFAATGGQGGPGGAGGNGGAGGDQPTKSIEVMEDGTKKSVTVATGRPGNGGNGGHGGDGGDGGNGGSIEVIYDPAFPELRNFIATDVRGGAEGEGGQAGGGGNGGGTNAERDAAQGTRGNDGQPGRNGRQGNEGRATVRAGSVQNQFRNIHGITIGGGGSASAATPPPTNPEPPTRPAPTPRPKSKAKHGRHK